MKNGIRSQLRHALWAYAAWGSLVLLTANAAQAQGVPMRTDPVVPIRTDPVVVTGTRVERPAFDVPGSIDRVDGSDVRDARMQVNLSESVGAVPGLGAPRARHVRQGRAASVRGPRARVRGAGAASPRGWRPGRGRAWLRGHWCRPRRTVLTGPLPPQRFRRAWWPSP